MHQKAYITDVINRFGMEDSNTVETPFDSPVRLSKNGSVIVRTGMSNGTTQGERSVHTASVGVSQKKRKVSQSLEQEPKLHYRELIGCLLWISMGKRPDNQCARYSSDPNKEHWTACLRILRYMKGTSYYGLHYHRHHSHYLGQNESAKASIKDL